MTHTHQLAKLRALFDALLSNPFYTRKLAATGLTAPIKSLDEFRARVPFTTKQELIEDQLRHPPFGTDLTYPLTRYTRFHQTSATTGKKPMRWLDTPESWNWMLDSWQQVYQAAGVTAADRIFFAFSFGPFLGFWVAFESAARMGCMCIPGGGMRSAARLRTMIDTGATVLCCTPTYALRLAEVAAEEKIDLAAAKIRRLIVAGEPGGSIPGTRARIEHLWHGARVVDHHGMTETGPVSYGCPKLPCVLHVIESAYFPEVIDGELVLTTLGRLGSPLIRYRTGDMVEPKRGPCECGTHDLALLGGIRGRIDDMVVVRGVNIYPSAVEEVLRACDGISEYRVQIRTSHSLPELSIQVEAEPAIAKMLEASLGNAFGLRIPVISVPRGELPRFDMKARRWIRL